MRGQLCVERAIFERRGNGLEGEYLVLEDGMRVSQSEFYSIKTSLHVPKQCSSFHPNIRCDMEEVLDPRELLWNF